MSSGFVSGGTNDAPIERSNEWVAAQKEIDAQHARKAAESHQNDGKSLYDVLQANKAAKQEAFEEANRLKNQFRALDEDEVDFLDSVLESTRAEEARIKRETAEGLELFRRQQEEADKKLRAAGSTQTSDETSPTNDEEQWVAGMRKRKRAKEKEILKGVKVRRSSSTTAPPSQASPSSAKESPAVSPSEGTAGKSTGIKASEGRAGAPNTELKKTSPNFTPQKKAETPKGGLGGLVDYGSDTESP
ncbi:N-terminal domain of NEFA-interacting nuclear protein NIP30-domain-containing protein [Xylogone sp. PMI_703]|nr:N-terminal domain of NEFA-interacting nuclear protein NIP30-domain-containing protein [Xylogone sp. PMI_703]